MDYFQRLISFLTLGSARPVRRLAAYYVLLGALCFALFSAFPGLEGLVSGERLEQLVTTPMLLQDGLATEEAQAVIPGLASRLDFGLSTAFVFLSTLALMLPVTWVYMSARPGHGHNQSLVQVLIVLPIVVAGVVLIVSNSLALAFSLAGVVAAVRFRTTLSDTRDIVFIFLAIAVGFAAGVQVITVALVLSVIFNFVLVLMWRYDFGGRPVLEPTAASQWAEPLGDLAGKDQGGNVVPDRDLVLALTPTKVLALAERFARVRDILGPDGKKPRFDAVLTVTTTTIAETQKQIETALDGVTKRWRFDKVITNTGKPSQLYYIVRTRKSVTRDALLTAVRAGSNGDIVSAEVEIGDALAREAGEAKRERKSREESE